VRAFWAFKLVAVTARFQPSPLAWLTSFFLRSLTALIQVQKMRPRYAGEAKARPLGEGQNK
jgi:hypothetical protein